MKIDVPLVQQLVADQFPHWAHLPVWPVDISGHDNRTFRLGQDMCVRLPSAESYAAHVEIEQIWLPKLAPHLPLSIPLPLAGGKPGHGYLWPWTVNTWLPGQNVDIERVHDLSQFADDLADFLKVLQSIDASDGPLPGKHNFHRGGDLSVYDAETRRCLDELRDLIDAESATAIWEAALQAKWTNPSVWIHGDVAVGNLLVDKGELCAVIDFGQLAAGDPACDTTIAWTFFSGPGRDVFRESLSVDEATWKRGRGWGLWKALLQLREHRTTNPTEAACAMRVIEDILSD